MPRSGYATCVSCRHSKPVAEFQSVRGIFSQPCSDCVSREQARRAKPVAAPPRLLQRLRELNRGAMTENELAVVGAARVAASRQWDLSVTDQTSAWALSQRLHNALFAHGLHLLPGSYTEAARIRGGAAIDFVRGDAGALTAYLLDLVTNRAYGSTAYILITEAWLPPEAINAFERHANRAIGVYPQAKEA